MSERPIARNGNQCRRTLSLILVAAVVLIIAFTAPSLAVDTYHVSHSSVASDRNPGTLQLPFRTIDAAAKRLSAGDTLIIHGGIYRESVLIDKSGTSSARILIEGEPSEKVILTGADLIPAEQWQRRNGLPVWEIPWNSYPKPPYYPTDERHKLVGRTEQVIVDGKLLRQVLTEGELRPGTFAIRYGLRGRLSVWLRDGDAPTLHYVEVSRRPVLLRLNGNFITVRNLILRFASNYAQQGDLQIEGDDDLVEDSTVEWTNGVGIAIDGQRNICRRLNVRLNGQLGITGHGANNLVDQCLLVGNNAKGFDKGWEAGGIKVAGATNFQIRRSAALLNNGPGVWFDAAVRHGVIDSNYLADNAGPGIEVEISEDILVNNNLCVRNGLVNEPGNWQDAGILIAESMRCDINHNTCANNRSGIAVRQQGIRTVDSRPAIRSYYSDRLIFRRNIAAFNREWQFAFFGDNPVFAGNQTISRSEARLLDPNQREWQMDHNLYYSQSGEGLITWGAPWQPLHKQYGELARFQHEHDLETGSVFANPDFINWQASNYRLQPNSPAIQIDAGAK
jgi:hypothetical protein